jgi:hypothetical protein
MLTIESLKGMSPNKVFSFGQSSDLDYFGHEFKWVAVRGGIHDWAMYYHHIDKDYDFIARCGDKVPQHIACKLIEASEDAANMYRN